MPYVLTENGNIKVGTKGQPLFYAKDKEEKDAFEIDAEGANSKITALVEESNGRRKKLGDATTALEEATAANAALQTKVDGIDDKNKVKIDELTDSINKVWEGKQKSWEEEKVTLNNQLFNATTGTKFATSKVAKTLVLPADIALATFGKSFQPDGSAKDAAGNTILSTENPGKPAEFDEALTYLINEYPNKDSIIRSAASGGDGHQSGSGGGEDQNLSAKDNIKAGMAALTK